VPWVHPATPHVQPALAAICDRAVAPIRDHRYANALELQQDLEDYLAQQRMRASSRDVGAFVAEKFAADREKVRKIIEAQLKDVRWSQPQRATGQHLPSLELTSAQYGDKPSPFKTSETERIITSPSQVGVPAQSSPLPAMSQPGTAPTNSGAALPVPRPPGRAPLLPLVAVGLFTLALLGVGVKLLLRPTEPPVAATAAPATAAPATKAEERPPTPDAVNIIVRVRPAEAKVYLDDALLSEGPYAGKLPRSDKPHKLRVEAEHFVTKEETVPLTGDVMLSFDLVREEGAPTKPVPQGRGPAPRQPGDGKGKPRHDIDSDSPYQRP
jgi:eukaryotic-like serine/threonine-protein kinase